jgi:hypothetical protein
VKTVFVLGAAANKELDPLNPMPIGSELASKIRLHLNAELNNLNSIESGPISNALSRSINGFSGDHIEAMRRIESGITFKESIDEFIDEWRDSPYVEQIAKLAIAIEILNAERTMNLGAAGHDSLAISSALHVIRESWLGLVLRLCNPHARRRDAAEVLDGIAFVTFNYDRCLEYTLFRYFNHSQGMPASDAAMAVKRIPILHAYGSLGELPILSGQGVEFGAPLDHASAAAASIRTFTEEVESEHAEKLQSVVFDSDRLIFIGFGFHRRNLELLIPTGCNPKTTVWGTVISMRGPAVQRVSEILKGSQMARYLEARTCRDLVFEHQDQLFT